MFDPSLKGHTAIRKRLLERLQGNKLSGSLLFTGPDGIGKRRVALELAQRELCFRRNACGVCEGCRPFKGDTLPTELPNLLRIAPEGKAGLIKIGMIREDDLVEGGVIRWVHQAPPPACHRWILVEDAHRLNGASANMLLKTLEEPPPGAHFLLITHRPEAMLATIRSRCERIPFTALRDEEAWEVAQVMGWGDSDLDRWIALSSGTLRYLDPALFSKAVDQLDAWLRLAEGESFGDAGDPLLPEKSATVAQSEQMAQCLELLLLLLSDVSRLREGRPLRLEPWRTRIESIAQSPLHLGKAQELAFGALRHLTRNPFAESLLLEIGLALAPG
jgi:DNA polymerase III subunit delta'